MAPRVFISYVQENRDTVSRLVSDLRVAGIDVWFDHDTLPPGIFWRDEIRKAVRNHEFFIACFSHEYAKRDRTYMNEELELAIDEIRLRGSVPWFIPVLLSGEVPDREIGRNRTLRDIQFVALNDATWTESMRMLKATIAGIGTVAPSVRTALIARDTVKLFSGVGQSATDMFALDQGLWHARLEHTAQGHFSVWLLDHEGNRVELLTNVSDPFAGSKLFSLEKRGNFVLDVSAGGAWRIDIARLGQATDATSLVGKTQEGSGLVSFETDLHRFRLTHGGSGHFSVRMYRSSGQRSELLVNSAGEVDVTKALWMRHGAYAFDVSATGPWSITWERWDVAPE